MFLLCNTSFVMITKVNHCQSDQFSVGLNHLKSVRGLQDISRRLCVWESRVGIYLNECIDLFRSRSIYEKVLVLIL